MFLRFFLPLRNRSGRKEIFSVGAIFLKTCIVNATIVLSDHLIPDGKIAVADGRIADYGNDVNAAGMEIIDAKGLYVGPGLIDIHTHAADNVYFFDDPDATSDYSLKHGVTGIMPALYFNMNVSEYLRAIETIDASVDAGRFPNFLGYYMEGPYLNPRFGCEKENNPWRNPIRREDYLPVVKAVQNRARVFCVAPEREGILDFVRDVKQLVPNAIFSVAHSEATPAQTEGLIPFGLRLATHHTNATGTLVKYPECRGVCVDETVSYHSDIYAEMICDSKGIHVDPYMQRLIRKIKGDDRLILVSDSFVAYGPIPSGYDGVTDINFDFDGEIAGTRMTLDAACRNIMVHTGASVCDAFRFASANPATLLGITDRGRIQIGARADLVFVDHRFDVKNVMFAGNLL